MALSGTFGPAHAMDVAHLQRMLDEDEAAQKVPLLVVAHAGRRGVEGGGGWGGG